MYRSVVLFGPPGSGKGTMGKLLSLGGGHYHLSSGDLFRELDPQSPAGKLFAKYADHGKLIPDDVAVQIWEEHVQGLIRDGRYDPEKQLLLLDGIPRTERQFHLMEGSLDVRGVIVLEVSDIEQLIERLRGRAILEGRKDDQDEEVLKTRMEVYEKETRDLLEKFPSERIFRFDGSQAKLRVLRDILVGMSDIL